MLTRHHLLRVDRNAASDGPVDVLLDLRDDLRLAVPGLLALVVGVATPRTDGEVLQTAQVVVAIGVIDPAEVLGRRQECIGEGIGTGGRHLVAAVRVERHFERDAVGVLPGDGRLDVVGDHADGRGLSGRLPSRTRQAVLAGSAVALDAPAVVGEEHVVYVEAEVVARVPQVDPTGDVVDDHRRQDAGVLLVGVARDGELHLLHPVVAVDAEHDRFLVRSRNRSGDQGQQGASVLGHLGHAQGPPRAVGYGNRPDERRERRSHQREDLGREPVDAPAVQGAAGRPVRSGLGSRPSEGGHPTDPEGPLVVLDGRHLRVAERCRTMAGENDALVVGVAGLRGGVLQQLLDHGRSTGVVQVDHVVGNAPERQLVADHRHVSGPVVEHQHPEVDPGSRPVGKAR